MKNPEICKKKAEMNYDKENEGIYRSHGFGYAIQKYD